MDALQFERLARQLVALGPRVVAELLTEIQHRVDITGVVHDFASLDPQTLQQLGGDRFPPRLFAVGGDR